MKMLKNHRPPDVSVIVPTYREAENLPMLVERTFAALEGAGLSAEMIIIDDDSDDGTGEISAALARSWPVRLIIRRNARGLATAVIRGLNEARGSNLVVMDADLSHPPEAIPALVAACCQEGTDFAIGSRYVEGGMLDKNWTWFRRLNSRLAIWFARGLSNAADPMAGFFAISTETFQQARKLKPLGYKIGLELIVRCGCRNVVEIPIHFRDRTQGESKLDLRQQWLYLRHLGRLYRTRYSGFVRMIQFGLVGLSGVVVDLVAFWALLPTLPMMTARAIAIGIAMMSNFLLNREVTFADSKKNHILHDFLRFAIACSLGALTNWGVFALLSVIHPTFAAQPLWGAGLGVLVGSILNYLLCSSWVFSEEPEPPTTKNEKPQPRFKDDPNLPQMISESLTGSAALE